MKVNNSSRSQKDFQVTEWREISSLGTTHIVNFFSSGHLFWSTLGRQTCKIFSVSFSKILHAFHRIDFQKTFCWEGRLDFELIPRCFSLHIHRFCVAGSPLHLYWAMNSWVHCTLDLPASILLLQSLPDLTDWWYSLMWCMGIISYFLCRYNDLKRNQTATLVFFMIRLSSF